MKTRRSLLSPRESLSADDEARNITVLLQALQFVHETFLGINFVFANLDLSENAILQKRSHCLACFDSYLHT